jgi:AI-2 transport protein TqsA
MLPRGLIVLLGMTGLLVTILALQQFAAIIAPVLLALVLVIGFHPLTGILRRRGAPLWLAVTVTLLTLVVVVVGLAASLVLSVAQLATILPTYEAQFTQLTNELRAWLGSLGVGPQQLQEALGKINFGNVAGVLAGLLASLAGVFSNLLLLLFVVAFMALDAVGFSSRLSRVRRERPEVVGALDKFVGGTRSYLLVSTVFGLIVAAIDAGFLWSIGIPLPLLWGLLAFITNYIPNIGFVIGVVPPALLALLQGGPRLMVIVILVYSVINFIIQSIIQPKFVADAVDLSLTLTFLSLIFWSFVIGPLGAVLAIPLTLLTKALLIDVDPSTQWMSSLVTGGPAPPNDDTDDESALAPQPEPETPPEGGALVGEGQSTGSSPTERRPIDSPGGRSPVDGGHVTAL